MVIEDPVGKAWYLSSLLCAGLTSPCICRKHERRVFQVVGCDVKELERWGLSQTGQDLSLEGDPA